MKNTISRRNFLHFTVGATVGGMMGVSSMPMDAQELAAPPTDAVPLDVSFGIIGVGMQGSGLLRNSIAIPGVKCVAACDLYDERHILAKEIAGTNISTTRSYRDLLQREDISCVIVATPDHWHKQIMIDAVRAGKDVYCEKPMSHSVAEGVEMVKAVQATNRIVQIGSQWVSSPLFIKAKEMIAAGAIGRVSLVEMTMGRNDPTGAWEYPPPPGLSEENLDWNTWLGDAPKIPFNPLHFARWRCWYAYGSGVAGDLMVHLISGMQFALGLKDMPDRAVAAGELIRWRDGRDVPDVHLVLFEYGKLIVSVRLTLDTDSPSTTRFMGSGGIIEVIPPVLTYTPQAGIDLTPSYYDSSFPHAMQEAYIQQWHAKNDPRLASLPPLGEAQSYKCVSCNDSEAHLRNFFTGVQNRTPVVEDVVFGHRAAAACHMANQSYLKRAPVTKEEVLSRFS